MISLCKAMGSSSYPYESYNNSIWKLQFPALDTLVSRLGNWRFLPWKL